MASPSRKLFVNLPVRDLDRSMAFFTALGFAFDPQFTNEQGASMVISAECNVMLLTAPFFQTFTQKAICDTATHTETHLCLSCESRDEVDALVKRAIEAGGRAAQDPEDHGFMYGCSVYDLDEHAWEFVWMDPSWTPPTA